MLNLGQRAGKTGTVIGIAMALVFAGHIAHAQSTDQGRYQNQLVRLSEILGSLHHLRGTCISGERQLWRDNMQELIRLENPISTRKNAMVARFNEAYEEASDRFPRCDGKAREEAIRLAGEGASLSDALARNIAR